jgi:hypothetical protein
MKRSLCLRLYLCVALVVLLAACAKPPQTETPPPTPETPAITPLPPAPPPAPTPASMPAPTPAEVRAAIARVYKGAVRVKEDAAPRFTIGDFNGDQAQDIAVVVEPVKEQLEELNSDVAPWRIRDPLSATLPPAVMAVKREAPPARLVITAGDTLLLAIIHGYGPQGWRDPEARQTILLKNAAGDPFRAQPGRAALAAIKGPTPPLQGDVIQMTLADTAGFLYYSGSSYLWYDPRRFRNEAAARMAHAAVGMNR